MLNNVKKLIVRHFSVAKKVYLLRDNRRKCKMLKNASKNQKVALAKLRNKETIRCVFFALDSSVWKYDSVFLKMMENPRFEPIILVCPIVEWGKESMINKMEEAYQCYVKKGYPTVKAYDVNTDKYIDVRKELNPDMIVYTNPYKGYIDDRYYVAKYLDVLSFYVHYGYNSVTKWDMLYLQPLTNVVWRYYVESPLHLTYIHDHAFNKGINAVVTGYPGIEELLDSHYQIKEDPWKIKDKKTKRIIWAPHHSIETNGPVHFSNFLKYADFMLEIAEKYRDHIQIAFKPHPILKDKLIQLWGKERTENYYNKWEKMPNTMVSEGEYTDLFLTSDAMIHDSGSFLIEYLYVRKPVMRLMNNDNMETLLNSFAKKCLDVYYKGYSNDDIVSFVKNLIEEIDTMKEVREKHYYEYLQPINGKLPSENIIEDILDSIDNQILYRN